MVSCARWLLCLALLLLHLVGVDIANDDGQQWKNCNVTFTVLYFNSVSAAVIYDWSTLLNIKGSMDGYCDIWESYRKTFPPHLSVCYCPQNDGLSLPRWEWCPGETEKIPEASFFAVGRLPVSRLTHGSKCRLRAGKQKVDNLLTQKGNHSDVYIQ